MTAAVAVALAVTACGGGSSDVADSARESNALRPPEVEQARAGLKKEVSTRFVGKVEGTDALIGLTDRAGQLSAYICDSAQLAVWLSGTVSGSTLTAANGPAALDGNLQGDGVTGKLTLPDGSVHAFTATKTTDPSAGLFQAVGISEDRQLVRAGWVTLPGGEQRGAAKTGNVVKPVVKLDAKTRVFLGGTAGGTPIEPPNPVTTAWCEDAKNMYWAQIDFYTSLKDQGDTENAGIVLKRIQSLDQMMEDFGCWDA